MQLLETLRFIRGALAAVVLTGASACGGGGGGGVGGGVPASANPVLGSMSFATNENVALSANVTATDPGGGQVTFTQGGNPKSGTVSGFTAAGAFAYQPTANFTGSDSFPITATDPAGHTTTGTVSITVTVDHPPAAHNTVLRADGAALASINVLTNASDPDKDKLTVTITDDTEDVGTATVNADGSVSITGLPSGFKGLTRFKYQVTDPSGKSAAAAAVIFVGADPFRAAFVGDATANGAYEVYLTDFAGDPQAVTMATQGTLQLKGFAISDNGATVVYRTQDTAASRSSLSFVQTATPTQQVSIALPGGATPVQDSQGNDQFRVSPDGQWIALIAGQGATNSVYVVNVAQPTVVSQVIPAAAAYTTQPTFSPDSKSLYFLATSVPGGANKSLYFAALSNPAATALICAASSPGTADDVANYSVSQDQSRIVVKANRGGRWGLYFIDPAHLQTEIQVSHTFASGEVLYSSTIDSLPGNASSASGAMIGYTTQNFSGAPATRTAYLAAVSAAPQPQPIASGGAVAIAFRPDDAALLYTTGSQVFEALIGSTAAAQPVGAGSNGWYDSTGNIALLAQALPSGGSPVYYPALAQAVRGSFGTTHQVGSGSMAAQYSNTTGFDRGVVIIGEGPTVGAAATTAQLVLVNALAPTKLLPLAGFQSPLQLTSDIAKVVTN